MDETTQGAKDENAMIWMNFEDDKNYDDNGDHLDDNDDEDDDDEDDNGQGVTDGEPAESRTRPTTASRIPRKVILTMRMRMIIQKSHER